MGTTKPGVRAERSANTERLASGLGALGRRIRASRTHEGLSVQELALRAGVGAPALASLERGEESSRIATVFAVADALNVPISSLFRGDTAPAADSRLERLGAQPVPARAPRTFADLRTGPLEGRTFDTLPQFAVAAVVEGGHSVSAIARVFRVPAWRLQEWVDQRLATEGAPQPVPRRFR